MEINGRVEISINISDWSNLQYANTRVQQYASWDGTLIAMVDVCYQYNLSINTIL